MAVRCCKDLLANFKRLRIPLADIDLIFQGAHTNSPNVKLTAAVGDSKSFPSDRLTINLKLISEDTKKALRFFLDGFDHKADIFLSFKNDDHIYTFR